MAAYTSLSPSSRVRWGICPGSVEAESKYPWVDSGPAAKDGTHSHTLLEHCIKNSIDNALVLVRTEMRDKEGNFVVDNARALRVNVALDYINAQCATNENAIVISERKVDPYVLTLRSGMRGTADVTIVTDNNIEIIDYKDGMGYVSAVDNKQLELYALGVMAETSCSAIKTVTMTIIQPKLPRPVSSSTLTISDIRALIPKIQAEYDAVHSDNPKLVAGADQCKYCKAKASCKALVDNVMTGFNIVTEAKVTNNVVDMANQAATQNPAEMSASQLTQIIEAAPLLRQLLDAVEVEAKKRIEAGEVVDGLKIVKGRGMRSWNCDENEMADKLIKMGIPKSEVYIQKLVSPAQAEKITWLKRDGTKSSLSERQIKRIETDYVIKSGGKNTVVLDSDPRDAVVFTSNVEAMFGAVNTTTTTTTNVDDLFT